MTEEARVYALIVAAGSGRRMGAKIPKQFLKIGDRTILEATVEAFSTVLPEQQIVIVTTEEYVEFCCRLFRNGAVVAGGAERQDSVALGLAYLREQGMTEQDLVLIHDGVRPYASPQLIQRVLDQAQIDGAVVPALPVKETIRHAENGNLDRSQLYAVQTPQGFRAGILLAAYEAARRDGFYGTDDAGLVERMGHKVTIVPGEETNLKITTREDLKMEQRIGTGYDVHRLEEGYDLVLGGVPIPYEKGLKGHSDADVVVHALMDSMLGAAAMGDIGKLFPDTDPQLAGISSIVLLQRCWEEISKCGYQFGNADMTIICQKPKLAPYIETMRENISKTLGVSPACISVKATTTEKLGFAGRGEGIAAEAVTLLKK